MKLAQGEQILKEWNYASSRQKGEKKSASLIVTNKRIVSDVSGNLETSRQEIPLDSVKSLYMKNRTPSKAQPVFLIVFGVILIILGIGLMSKIGSIALLGAAGIPGALLIVIGIILLSRIAFTLTITTNGVEGDPMEIGASSFSKSKKKAGKIKVKVDKDVVGDIFESLGAVILTYKK